MDTKRKKTGRAKEPLELYIHIPFCARKCLYCDFLSFPASAEVREQYVGQIVEELAAMGELFAQSRQVVSVFLGGGTPSLLEPEQIGRIMGTIRRSFFLPGSAEVTMEANPGTLTKEKLEGCRSAGINRLSLGLQSADDSELKNLGRIHSWPDFLESFSLARAAGFDNINVDLMSALPGQTEASYRRTLEAVTALKPEHISAYSLIIEEGTPFCERYGEKEAPGTGGPSRSFDRPGPGALLGAGAGEAPALPDEETERELYHLTKKFLMDRGYGRYEISNYAREGFECRHNLGYWTGIPYLGIGLGASSCLDGGRFSNEADLNRYLGFSGEEFRGRIHHRERHVLTREESMEEFMFLGLRLSGGISEEEFAKRFGVSMESVYGTVTEKFLREGLLERSVPPDAAQSQNSGARLRLTDWGIDVSNQVLCEFLLDCG